MRFEILGPLQVVDETGTVRLIAAPRLRVLLAGLLLRANQPVPVEELAETVWEGAPPPRAGVTLRTYVMRLRRALGPAGAARIVTRDPGYLVRLAAPELDVLQFEALCQQAGTAARAGAWDEVSAHACAALALWRGTPLVDVASRALRDGTVPHLDRLRVQALEWRVDADLHRGRSEQVIPQLHDLVAEHPLRERFHAQLMLALARCGRSAEALAVYRQAREMLVGELGIDPGPELRDAQERVLAGMPGPDTDEPAAGTAGAGTGASRPATRAGPPVVVPQQLPAPVRHFTGRGRELRALSRLLDEADAVPVAAIGGTAGVGKTCLAVRWAHQVADRFRDGQLYVNLRGFDPAGQVTDPAAAIRGFLDALGVPPERIPAGPDAQAALYRSVLAGRRVLVVIDNARDAEHARPLLPGTGAALAVVTSRSSLAGLVAADGAQPLTLDLLTDTEARDLLERRLTTDRVGAEPDAVDQIIAACARLPLALALVAARAATHPGFPLATLAAELTDTTRRLNALDTGDVLGQVQAVFSWSYTTLSAPAARLFRLLGLHPGPHITTAAAASLAGLPPAHVRPLLAELTCTGLLDEPAPGRYGFHDLLAAYATRLTHGTDADRERERATVRLLDHYTHTAHGADQQLNPGRSCISIELGPPDPGAAAEPLGDQQAALEWLDAERPVLLAAQQLANDVGRHTHAWQLAWALNTVLDRRAHWHELVGVWRAALPAAGRLPHPATAYAHRCLGRVMARLGDDGQADTHLHDALYLYSDAEDHLGQAYAHLMLGYLWERRGKPDQALDHAEQAHALFQLAGHRRGQADALNAVGWCHALLGDHTLARTDCEQALALLQELGDRVGEAAAWDSLGYTNHHLGHYTDATDCYQRALALYTDLGDHYERADTLTHLGDTHHAAGQPDQARAAWTIALDIFTTLDHPGADDLRTKIDDLNQ